ncbi:MAG: metallophosphoesterase [Planctomycetales bacterium]|nr:metallophosphoesterase [Planctomycetales bacterium]
MKRIAWLTDIHLNFVDDDRFDEFLLALHDCDADAYLLGGDIAEAPSCLSYLEKIDRQLGKPIYFVLGNHDYYHGSIPAVREAATELCRQRPLLHFLTSGVVIPLAQDVGLVGHDGWADGRAGNYAQSNVMLSDYRLIKEFAPMFFEPAARGKLLAALGDEAAVAIRTSLLVALERFEHVYLLMHVPPLREACWHEGRISDDDWAPHFVCQAAGEAILDLMSRHSTHKLTVLCGHTHSDGVCRPLPNVEILTGRAEYRFPEIQQVFTLGKAP